MMLPTRSCPRQFAVKGGGEFASETAGGVAFSSAASGAAFWEVRLLIVIFPQSCSSRFVSSGSRLVARRRFFSVWRLPSGKLWCRSRRRCPLAGLDPPKERRRATHLEEIHCDHCERERNEQYHDEPVINIQAGMFRIATGKRQELHIALEPSERHVARRFAFGQRPLRGQQ